MKRLAVIIAPTVQDQITTQMLHIAAHSIGNALAWEARLCAIMLCAVIEKMGESPGYPIDEDATERLGHGARKSVFEGTYFIHYILDDRADVVRIVNFRHGARLPLRGEP